MSSASAGQRLSAEMLREAFDRSFAVAPPAVEQAHHDLLTLHIGGDPYAVHLSHVGAIFVGKQLTWLPGSVPQLVGVVALRGAILAVYDLAALLGYPRAVSPRWCLTAAGSSVALAFDRFDGHRRVTADAMSASHRTETHPYLREVVRLDDLARPLVDIPSVVDAIARLAPAPERRSID